MEAAQNQELWERSHTKPGDDCKLLKSKNGNRCSASLRICIKQAKQNQELWERSHTKPGDNSCGLLKVRMESYVPFRFGFVLSYSYGSQTKPGAVGKKPHKTRRESMLATQRLKSDVPLQLGFELWKPNKTRSCGKEAIQNQEIIANCSKVRMESDVPLRFGFVLSELWKPNKTRSCGGSHTKPGDNPFSVRMESDVPFRLGFVLSELWKANKTRSWGRKPYKTKR